MKCLLPRLFQLAFRLLNLAYLVLEFCLVHIGWYQLNLGAAQLVVEFRTPKNASSKHLDWEAKFTDTHTALLVQLSYDFRLESNNYNPLFIFLYPQLLRSKKVVGTFVKLYHNSLARIVLYP